MGFFIAHFLGFSLLTFRIQFALIQSNYEWLNESEKAARAAWKNEWPVLHRRSIVLQRPYIIHPDAADHGEKNNLKKVVEKFGKTI